jgi:hypothetical protein
VAVVGVRGTQFVVGHNEATNTTEVTTISGEVQVNKIGTMTDVLGFGDNGKLFIKSQQRIKVKKRSTEAVIETLKDKEFETLKKDTDVLDDEENKDSKINK